MKNPLSLKHGPMKYQAMHYSHCAAKVLKHAEGPMKALIIVLSIVLSGDILSTKGAVRQKHHLQLLLLQRHRIASPKALF